MVHSLCMRPNVVYTLINHRKNKNHFLNDFVVVVVALLFNVHGKHLRSCGDGQLT